MTKMMAAVKMVTAAMLAAVTVVTSMSHIRKSNDFRRPEIISDIEHTELKLWNIDLIDSYPDLSEDEKSALRYFVKNGADKSLRDVAPILDMTEYRLRKAVASLEEEKHIIKKVGNGRATRYVLEMESVEMLTHLQMALDVLKRRI